MRIFLCEDDFEWILCGIYDAWRVGDHSQTRIELRDTCQRELFCQYTEVKREKEKAEKVIRSVKRKLSDAYFYRFYQVFLSCALDKADVMYRMLIKGFSLGVRALDMLQDPDMARAFELARAVGRESHFFTEFLRFEKVRNDIYAARIEPKNNVLPVIADHFSDRLNPEHFFIYDGTRGEAVIHPAGNPWFLLKLSPKEWREIFQEMRKQYHSRREPQEDYQELWRLFVDTIAVDGRINPKLQRQMMPYRYRGHMPEFGSSFWDDLC